MIKGYSSVLDIEYNTGRLCLPIFDHILISGKFPVIVNNFQRVCLGIRKISLCWAWLFPQIQHGHQFNIIISLTLIYKIKIQLLVPLHVSHAILSHFRRASDKKFKTTRPTLVTFHLLLTSSEVFFFFFLLSFR